MKTISKLIYVALAVVSLATGAVTAQGALNDLFVSINSDGSNGGGSINEYTPTGVQSLFASGLSQPRGMAFDRFGNLLVANSTLDVNQTLQGTIIKISPGGVQSLFANVLAQGPIGVFLEGLAFDHAGNLFVMHGFALNVCGDLSPFNHIVPCGINNVAMTSIEKETGTPVSVSCIAASLERLAPNQICDLRVTRKAPPINV